MSKPADSASTEGASGDRVSLISHPSSGRVLCIGGGNVIRVSTLLEHSQYQVSKLAAASPDDRITKLIATFIPDIIFVNLASDDERSLSILELLAYDRRTNGIPIVATIADDIPEAKCIEAYGRSSCDFVRSDASATEILAKSHMLLRLARSRAPGPRIVTSAPPPNEQAANDDAQAIRLRDHDTGLCTKEYLYHRISSEVTRARRYERSLSVLAIRCGDHNSQAAHRSIAGKLRAILRRPDVVANFGENFWVALLPEAEVNDINNLMARLRTELAEFGTCAFGRAGLDHDGGMGAHTPEDLIHAAREKCDAGAPPPTSA